ncbi:hypothetical protein [Kitasatospora griseola]
MGNTHRQYGFVLLRAGAAARMHKNTPWFGRAAEAEAAIVENFARSA